MESIGYVLELLDFSDGRDWATTIECHDRHVFIGTKEGSLMQVAVEGPLHVTFQDGVSTGPIVEDWVSPPLVTTNFIRRETVPLASWGEARGKKQVEKLSHSSIVSRLFVLCGGVLSLWDTNSLSVIGVVEREVSTFSLIDYFQGCSESGGRNGAEDHHFRICVAKNNTSTVSILNIVANSEKDIRQVVEGKHIVPVVVTSLTHYKSLLCVGSVEEYSLLDMKTGVSRSVLRLDGDQPPLMSVIDDSLFMVYHKSVCWTSVLRKEKMNYSIPGSEAGMGMWCCFPYIYVFGVTVCMVFSVLEKKWVEEIPLGGVSLTASCGPSFFLASNGKNLWLIRISTFTHQLATLLQKGKVSSAFQLLSARTSLLTEQEHHSIRRELHLKAGFYYLYRRRPREAFTFFSTYVDPRNILLHSPDLIPPPPDSYSFELQGLLRRQRRRRIKYVLRQVSNDVVTAEGSVETLSDSLPSMDYWEGFETPCVYDSQSLWEAWRNDHELPHNNSPSGGELCRKSWDTFKEALLSHLLKVQSLESLPSGWRRPTEYAVFVLCLECGDHSRTFDMACNSAHLQIEDIYDLLIRYKEFRLLALILLRKGWVEEAEKFACQRASLLKNKESESSYFENFEAKFTFLESKMKSGLGSDVARYVQRVKTTFPEYQFLTKSAPLRGYQYVLEYFADEDEMNTPTAVFPFYGPSWYFTREQLLLPGGFHVAFHYCDHQDCAALFQLEEAFTEFLRDEEGLTVAHHSIHWLSMMKGSPTVKGKNEYLLTSVLQCLKLFCSKKDHCHFLFESIVTPEVLGLMNINLRPMDLIVSAVAAYTDTFFV